MRRTDSMFAASQLKMLRAEAKRLKISIPKNLTAVRNSIGNWFLVEGDGNYKFEVTADSGLDARVKAIRDIINKTEKQ